MTKKIEVLEIVKVKGKRTKHTRPAVTFKLLGYREANDLDQFFGVTDQYQRAIEVKK